MSGVHEMNAGGIVLSAKVSLDNLAKETFKYNSDDYDDSSETRAVKLTPAR